MRKVLILLMIVLPTLVVASMLLWATGVFKPAVGVSVVPVKRSAFRRSITTNGRIEADRVTELHAPVAGTCRRSDVHTGVRLAKGMEILRIEDPSFPAQLAAAQAEQDAASLELRDIQRGPTPEERDQVEADAARAELAVQNARKTVETNEWLLTREAISRYEVEQSRQSLAAAEQVLKAVQIKMQDLKNRYGDLDRRRAQSRVDAARARLQYLEESRERRIIRAPADGTLYQLDTKDGAFVNAGETLGLFADLTHLYLKAYVDEPDLGLLAPGEKVIIRWDAHPQETWQGTVMRLPADVVALGTRSVAEVPCSIESPLGALLLNTNVDVEIDTPEGPSVASLPRNLVFPEGGRQFVWVVDHGRAVRRYVQTGRTTSDMIEITGGLSLGDEVIDPDDLLLSDGMKVAVKAK